MQDEPHHFNPQQKARKHIPYFWQKTSLAIAASAAFVVVMLTQQASMQTLEPAQQIADAQQQVTRSPVQLAQTSEPTQHERLKAYLQAHNNDLYTHGSSNVYPIARVASYGQE